MLKVSDEFGESLNRANMPWPIVERGQVYSVIMIFTLDSEQ